MGRFIILICILLLSTSFGQDFSLYKKIMDEGKIEEIRGSLPHLLSTYPNHPFVLYLKTAYDSDGDNAVAIYQSIIRDHPGTMASELSIMKVGEYCYSKGLYSQASEQLKMIPLNYPESKNIERAVSLMKKSYSATGEQDSIDYYVDLFGKKYPKLNFKDYDHYSSMVEESGKTAPRKTSIGTTAKNDKQQINLVEKPWIVQVGAFSNKKNTENIVNRLKTVGYDVEVVKTTGGRSLSLVQIVRFATMEQAVIVGEKVKDQFGLDFRVLKRK